jgi:cytochrome c oxidase subunit 3
MNSSRPIKKKKQTSWVYRLESQHPHAMIIYLVMLGVGMLFLFLTGAYFLTLSKNNMIAFAHFPKSFIISTILIIISSFTLRNSVKYFNEDNLQKLRSTLLITFMIGVCFCCFQVVGWYELTQSKVFFTGAASGTFLYLISGLHILHLLGGMAFMVIEYRFVKQLETDSVQRLVLTTSPYEKMRINLLTQYWHLMDLIWVLLFFCFLLACK